jgi:hypothetical protein
MRDEPSFASWIAERASLWDLRHIHDGRLLLSRNIPKRKLVQSHYLINRLIDWRRSTVVELLVEFFLENRNELIHVSGL